jgi:N-glycosylase/DNA lyase
LTRPFVAVSPSGGKNSKTTNGRPIFEDLNQGLILLPHRSCAIYGRIITLKQDSTSLHYRTIRPRSTSPLPSLASSKAPSVGKEVEDDDAEPLIRQYLNLAPNLSALYEHWSSKDPNFKRRAQKFTGIRILRQDAWEALVGFICSSNNNISRISQMV